MKALDHLGQCGKPQDIFNAWVSNTPSNACDEH